MTTDSNENGSVDLRDKAWNGEGITACTLWLDAHPEWAAIPGARYYEASHRGNGIRSLDRTVSGRQLRGKVLSAAPGGSGYPKTKITRDDGSTPTVYVHAAVLLAHAGPVPDGEETLHGNGGPLDSRYCGCPAAECAEGNLRYGTHVVNVGETIAAGNARRPATHPCVNHERCGGMVVNAGSRCLPCVTATARRAAVMQRAGINLEPATRKLGYESQDWVRKITVKYGGGSPTWTSCSPWHRRVAATLRYWLLIVTGDAK